MTSALSARVGRTAREGVFPLGLDPMGAAIAGLLVLDALITLVLEVLFLPLYVGQGTLPTAAPGMGEAAAPIASGVSTGAIALPLSALAAAVINVLLVHGMGTVSPSFAAMSLPLSAWTVGFALMIFSGPGGDIMLLQDWPTLALLVGGLLPAGLYLYWRATAHYAGESGR
ncbi:hypothetical protein ACWDOP_31365 [Nocardia sp. NPDC003693]